MLFDFRDFSRTNTLPVWNRIYFRKIFVTDLEQIFFGEIILFRVLGFWISRTLSSLALEFYRYILSANIKKWKNICNFCAVIHNYLQYKQQLTNERTTL
jgi:hypothetical protein